MPVGRRLKYDTIACEKIGDSKRRKRKGKNKYWRYKKSDLIHPEERRMSSEYSTEEEHERLQKALAALEKRINLCRCGVCSERRC